MVYFYTFTIAFNLTFYTNLLTLALLKIVKLKKRFIVIYKIRQIHLHLFNHYRVRRAKNTPRCELRPFYASSFIFIK